MTPAHIGTCLMHLQDLGTGHLTDDRGVAERQDREHVPVGQQRGAWVPPTQPVLTHAVPL